MSDNPLDEFVPKNPIMAGQAKDLTTKEMEALAEYYSKQHSTLHIVPLHRLAKEDS